jgi:peroxiredoxin
MSAPVPGEPAPPLALATLDGRPFDLRGLRGRPVLVSFLRHAG